MFELQKNKQVRSYIIKGYCSFQILSGNGDTRAKGCAPVTTHFCDKNKEMHIQAKTNDRRVRRFGDILAPFSRETKLKMRLRE